ncbi:MAG TPA: aspartate 1-decarboxylase [Thermodesulfovibrio thiophilus]|uniref:aspartate 1-decarboxylase n=1 Tax=Thermodesulfovibrio thiophilus TaxID=340095 RepID=UPI000419BCEE|nr:aspartate 1-decarboxylase [Thermodesulfovibrio thiophilus]HHW20317.1 aspartate 1-decarboxylase [Thermodesulfovibrio thiophilus]HOA82646.1 aspartate 1-decarboxylase [Thermodesulfovibrio thiophilus]HQA03339.1 aspartate 1-decarboxylase [Thermodesulfovibrio thiophilus]HQD35749.1 aspartate 1-decarboxylase [Thermodesulfovibrio thiophilus]
MLRSFLRAKLHLAKVTETNLFYEGSVSIDTNLLELSGILPYERVWISNMSNGERFDTYVIPAKKGTKTIGLNGPAAKKASPGDRIVIFSYGYLTENEISSHKPRIVILDENNNPVKVYSASIYSDSL